MKNQNLFFKEIFTENKIKNKWLFQLATCLLLNIGIMIIGSTFSKSSINYIYILIFSLLSISVMIFIYYIVILIFSKIFKSDVENKEIFISSVSIVCIITAVKIIVSIIQLIFSIDTNKYDLLNLGIFNDKNVLLSSIDFYTLLSGYLLTLSFYYVSKFKLSLSIILGLTFTFLDFIFNFLFNSLNQAIM
uniref:Yip1 domain-containing protein n=1 Tax=Staphylococcus epidermidis TaxID=1282 RepID=H9BG69_STAEP|nr:epidermicin locus hypothetical protein [Staphylococcus epidermidis]UVZ00166.1 hypothetical protein [Staphylococcus epidermidis]